MLKCGTLWAETNTRDTDWYQLSLTDTDNDGLVHVNISLSAELPVAALILDTDPGGDGDCFGTDGLFLFSQLFVDPTCAT